MFKRMVARLMLFGIPFAMAYVATRPTPTPPMATTVPSGCIYPGSAEGSFELRFEASPCASIEVREGTRTYPAWILPAAQEAPGGLLDQKNPGDVINLPF